MKEAYVKLYMVKHDNPSSSGLKKGDLVFRVFNHPGWTEQILKGGESSSVFAYYFQMTKGDYYQSYNGGHFLAWALMRDQVVLCHSFSLLV